MRETIDQLVESQRFHMNTLYDSVWSMFASDETIAPNINIIREKISAKQYKKLGKGILRHAFLIELVKLPGCETTKYRTRWHSQLNDDQRECSFSECLAIAQALVFELTDSWLNDSDKCIALNLFLNHEILPYELPIDYSEQPALHDLATKIHRRGNVEWVINQDVIRTLKLRQYLTNPQTSPDAQFFKKVLDKIKVKTYLTDRVQTGSHKTNREKRWEVHPHSVHFALRHVCMAIEYKLITQLCEFEGFPENSRKMLQEQDILPPELEIFCCPITLEPMLFHEFQEELMHPTHGRSNFQVGHLNPLKLDDPNSIISGHTPENISWISANGNRIQGSMSLEEVRNLLKRITHNYKDKGWT